jgi:hypothetical protein
MCGWIINLSGKQSRAFRIQPIKIHRDITGVGQSASVLLTNYIMDAKYPLSYNKPHNQIIHKGN